VADARVEVGAPPRGVRVWVEVAGVPVAPPAPLPPVVVVTAPPAGVRGSRSHG